MPEGLLNITMAILESATACTRMSWPFSTSFNMTRLSYPPDNISSLSKLHETERTPPLTPQHVRVAASRLSWSLGYLDGWKSGRKLDCGKRPICEPFRPKSKKPVTDLKRYLVVQLCNLELQFYLYHNSGSTLRYRPLMCGPKMNNNELGFPTLCRRYLPCCHSTFSGSREYLRLLSGLVKMETWIQHL
jgi:hypothetical protein